MRKLTFYSREQFGLLREEAERNGDELTSITFWFKIEEITENYRYQIVDLTSLAITPKEFNLQLELERLVVAFPYSTDFIADKKYEETFKYGLRHCNFEFVNFEGEATPEGSGPEELRETESGGIKIKKKRLVDIDPGKLDEFFQEFNNKLYGHQKFKDDFQNQVQTFRIFNRLGEHKVLSLFLMGDSGVGKTEVARVLQKCLKGTTKMAKINFGNYSSKDALNSLIGSPRGYIGSETGELFEKVAASDIGLILIDEFEKADAVVFNYFLDVLETGKMTNSQGEELDIDGYVLIFTSNISKEGFREIISPELRSRFNFKVHFSLLFDQDKAKFVNFRLVEIIAKLEERFNIHLPKEAYNSMAQKIRVAEYKNMRDLNRRIKEVFVEFITNYNTKPTQEKQIPEKSSND